MPSRVTRMFSTVTVTSVDGFTPKANDNVPDALEFAVKIASILPEAAGYVTTFDSGVVSDADVPRRTLRVADPSVPAKEKSALTLNLSPALNVRA